MKHVRYIVTGGAGFIGANLVRSLNADGITDLLVVDHLNHDGKRRNLDRLRFTAFMDKADFRCAVEGGRAPDAETVFHLGACSSTTETDEAYLMDNNFEYTRQLCRWSLERGARFIYASSAATYGDGTKGYSDDPAILDDLRPLNLYGLSKHRFDLWARNEGILDRIAGLKYFNVFGPMEGHKGDMRSVVHKAYGEIRATGELKLFRSHRPEYGDGEQLRDFVYVTDAVAVTRYLATNAGANGLFNCGTGRPRSWLDLARAVFAAMGREPRIRFIDMPVAIRDKYQYFTCADLSRLRHAGYTLPFTTLEVAVRDYILTELSVGS